MKKLILVRHAKSDWSNPLQKDFDRVLNTRGLNDAPMMGKRLLNNNFVPQLIISSTAARAKQTSELIANEMNYKLDVISFQNKLYHATPETITYTIEHVSNEINCLMIVCHNPGITLFVNSLSGFVTENLPTCGIAIFQLKRDDWQMIQHCESKLLLYDFPKNKI